MSRRNSRIIYVGNLPKDIREKEIGGLFYKYGPIVDIDLKIPARPPVYAFVEFEDPRDANDAIDGRDGYDFDGRRLRVELARGGKGPSFDRQSSYSSSGRRGASATRRTDYRVIVTGLPSSASWPISRFDVNDHMRRAGDVCFSDVYKEAGVITGIAEYTNYEDMKHGIRMLDYSEFRNASSRAYIRVREYDARRSCSYSRSRSRSCSYSRSRSRSCSYSRSRSRSYSRSRSPRSSSRSLSPAAPAREKSASRSPARSRSVPRSRSPVSPAAPAREKSASRSPARSRSVSCSRSPVSPAAPAHEKSASRSPARSRSVSRSRSPVSPAAPAHDKSASRSPARSRSVSRSQSPMHLKSPKNMSGLAGLGEYHVDYGCSVPGNSIATP